MFLFHYEAVVKKKLARAVDISGTRVLTSKMVQIGAAGGMVLLIVWVFVSCLSILVTWQLTSPRASGP